MKQDIQQHIRTCDRYQKRNPKKDEIPRQASKTPDYPFQHIGIDVMGPLPRTMTGKRYIVLAIDWLTKWPEAQAIETADAQTIAVFIHEQIIYQHEPPQQITSDRGILTVDIFGICKQRKKRKLDDSGHTRIQQVEWIQKIHSSRIYLA